MVRRECSHLDGRTDTEFTPQSTFSSVPLSYVNTYYLNRGGPKMGANGKLTAFPKGLKMIAGNNSAMDSPDPDSTKALAVDYVCLDYANGSNHTKT